MIEAVVLYFYLKQLANLAETKGRTRAWALLGLGAWVAAEAAGILIGLRFGLGKASLGPGLLLAGLTVPVVEMFVKRLDDSPGRKAYKAGAPLAQTCPRCRSLQTTRFGHQIRCFSCDFVGNPA